MKYDVLLFDADGTLFDFDAAEQKALTNLLAKAAIPAPPGTWARYHEINHLLWKELEQGKITGPVLQRLRFSRLLQALGVSSTWDAEALNTEYIRQLALCGQLMPGAFELCRELSSCLPLYIITNGVAVSQKSRLALSEIHQYISGMFISEEVGFSKPHRGFFDAVFSGLPPFDPERALVIGDSLSADIAGGVGYGLDTCWFNPLRLENTAPVTPTYEIETWAELPPLVLG